MKIGIFGGTFNPIHIGHINILKDIKKKLKLDVIYIIPTYITPDKKFVVERISPKHRFNMVKLAVNETNLEWLKISNYEFKKKEISYTFDTIRHFKSKFEEDDLYWIMGEDRYKNFDKWKNFNYIKNNAKIVVYRRKEKLNEVILKDKDVLYLRDKFYDISSTKILNELRWDLIPINTRKYIAKHKLYLKTIVFKNLGEKRYEHSVAVASHAKRLAVRNYYFTQEKAWNIGIIHDLFKLHSNKELNLYIEKKGKEFTNKEIPLPALHGFVVALWIRDEYLWKDKKVFNSLANHTLAIKKATKIDKIIFVADKISTDRKGNKVGKLRKQAYSNLNFTYIKIVKELVKKLEKRSINPHINTIEAYEYYTNRKYKGNKYEFNLKKNRSKTNK